MSQPADVTSSDGQSEAVVSSETRSRFGVLEIGLILAMHLLLYQLVPAALDNASKLGPVFFQLFDYTQWNATTWFSANTAVVVILILVRSGVNFKQGFISVISRIRDHIPSITSAVTSDDSAEAKRKLAADWRERAKRRLPFR